MTVNASAQGVDRARNKAHAKPKNRGEAARHKDVSPHCLLMESKSVPNRAMADFAKARQQLQATFTTATPSDEFALDQLAVLAVQYNHCLEAERALFQSEIKTLCPASIAGLRSSIDLFLDLRRCREVIQEEFATITDAVYRTMGNRLDEQMKTERPKQRPLPTTVFSTRTGEEDQMLANAHDGHHQGELRDCPKVQACDRALLSVNGGL